MQRSSSTTTGTSKNFVTCRFGTRRDASAAASSDSNFSWPATTFFPLRSSLISIPSHHYWFGWNSNPSIVLELGLIQRDDIRLYRPPEECHCTITSQFQI